MPKITSLRRVKSTGFVYDVCCSSPHNYSASNGLISHNCCVFLDEIEKQLAGSSESRSDGGVVQRAFGSLLTYMQDRDEGKSKAFFVATSNNIASIPSEMLRAGRWDSLVYVGLPGIKERKEIFKIKIKAAKRDPEKFNLDQLSQQYNGYTGAEIQAVVTEGLFLAYAKKTDIDTDMLLSVRNLNLVKPISITMENSIREVRDWAKTRCLMANVDDSYGDKFEQEMNVDI